MSAPILVFGQKDFELRNGWLNENLLLVIALLHELRVGLLALLIELKLTICAEKLTLWPFWVVGCKTGRAITLISICCQALQHLFWESKTRRWNRILRLHLALALGATVRRQGLVDRYFWLFNLINSSFTDIFSHFWCRLSPLFLILSLIYFNLFCIQFALFCIQYS